MTPAAASTRFDRWLKPLLPLLSSPSHSHSLFERLLMRIYPLEPTPPAAAILILSVNRPPPFGARLPQLTRKFPSRMSLRSLNPGAIDVGPPLGVSPCSHPLRIPSEDRTARTQSCQINWNDPDQNAVLGVGNSDMLAHWPGMCASENRARNAASLPIFPVQHSTIGCLIRLTTSPSSAIVVQSLTFPWSSQICQSVVQGTGTQTNANL